jgi:hypothetical protein
MKKTLSVLMMAAALGGVGMAAHAQDGGAECQASGRCGNVGRDKGLDANGNYDQRIADDNASKGIYPPNYGYYPWGNAYGLPGVIADGRWGQNYGYNNTPYAYASPYARTERDRDGDGVRNSRDRYPDDPRYR